MQGASAAARWPRTALASENSPTTFQCCTVLAVVGGRVSVQWSISGDTLAVRGGQVVIALASAFEPCAGDQQHTDVLRALPLQTTPV